MWAGREVAKLSEQLIQKHKNDSPEELVKLARAAHRNNKEIVKALTHLASAEAVAALAREWAPALGISEAEFKVIAGPR